ncbi:MAG: SET domain-containing protein-lysine N-methyltransferase [Steroidobacteraceae bacterium]
MSPPQSKQKPRKAVKPPKAARAGLYRVRRSKVHGLGAFASQAVRKGTRVAEYLGDRISHQEANRRYDTKDNKDNHTFLFTVDRYLVIDGGSNGNDARFINHSCDPNLEATVEQRRVFLDAVRSIKPGEELSFDYQIGRDKSDPPDIDQVFACRCGAELCRGTMLYPAKRPEPRKKKSKVVAKKGVKAKRKAARK